MTDVELLQRLSDHEDNFIERKSAGVKSQELRQTLSAFANSLTADREGILFLGIDDRTGAITGVPVGQADMLQKRVREAAESDCYPPIKTVTCRVLTVNGMAVVAVIVRASADRPHFTGPAYVRRLSESVKASPELFNELIVSRNDKAQAILAMRGGVVTFQSIGHKIGETLAIANQGYRQTGECRVEACDAHLVHLMILSGGMPGWPVVEPLSHVQIGFDVNKNRPMLVIRVHPG
jgi:hypothetical protein